MLDIGERLDKQEDHSIILDLNDIALSLANLLWNDDIFASYYCLFSLDSFERKFYNARLMAISDSYYRAIFDGYGHISVWYISEQLDLYVIPSIFSLDNSSDLF
jgi:hypothetical protein